MNDWYSSYLFIRERQRELIRQAEQRRLLESVRSARRAKSSEGRPAGGSGSSEMRQRISAPLSSLGQGLE